jgi:hypothetical protein
VIATLNVDLALCLDAIVDDDLEPVALADRRNSPTSAVAEQLRYLVFTRQVDLVAELHFQA